MRDLEFIWFKNSIISSSSAQVNILSPTSQYGLNVFEGIRAYKNFNQDDILLFRFDDHIKRLQDSCKILCIDMPYSKSFILSQIIALVKANNVVDDMAFRCTIFVDGNGSWASKGPVEMFIAPVLKPRSDVKHINSLSACISSWRRLSDHSMPPMVKCGANYINSRYAIMQAKNSGYDIPIFLDSFSHVSESSGSCIFLVKNSTIITPTVTSSILESITRDTLFHICSACGYPVQVRDVNPTELYLADEVFVCGSAVEIAPIVKIDQHIIGDGSPGLITIKLLEQYHSIVSNITPDLNAWITPILQ